MKTTIAMLIVVLRFAGGPVEVGSDWSAAFEPDYGDTKEEYGFLARSSN